MGGGCLDENGPGIFREGDEIAFSVALGVLLITGVSISERVCLITVFYQVERSVRLSRARELRAARRVAPSFCELPNLSPWQRS